MRVSLFVGDITAVRADAICTSTNPRLSLVSGTGGAVRDRGGWEIKRACEKLLDRELHASGRRLLPLGSAHATPAGSLPAKIVIHCVASNAFHRSSEELIRACVRNALARADEAGCASVAMPVFGAGHAAFSFERALSAIKHALRDSSSRVEEVVIAVYDPERATEAARIVATSFPDMTIRPART